VVVWLNRHGRGADLPDHKEVRGFVHTSVPHEVKAIAHDSGAHREAFP